MSELITGTLSSVILYFPRASTFNPPKPPPGRLIMRHRRSYPAFRHDPHPLPSLQLADHSKRIFEDPPAPTYSNSVKRTGRWDKADGKPWKAREQ